MDNAYTPPGTIAVSVELAERLVDFYEGMDQKMIPIIFFSPTGKHRESKDSPWIDDGPTYNIGFIPTKDVPQHALQAYKTAYFVIDIPEENWRNAPLRLLDFEPDSPRIVLK